VDRDEQHEHLCNDLETRCVTKFSHQTSRSWSGLCAFQFAVKTGAQLKRCHRPNAREFNLTN